MPFKLTVKCQEDENQDKADLGVETEKSNIIKTAEMVYSVFLIQK